MYTYSHQFYNKLILLKSMEIYDLCSCVNKTNFENKIDLTKIKQSTASIFCEQYQKFIFQTKTEVRKIKYFHTFLKEAGCMIRT